MALQRRIYSGSASDVFDGFACAAMDAMGDNERETSSRKTVKCRDLAAHPPATARGCPHHSFALGLPICACSCA
jgi:hypothetical protein